MPAAEAARGAAAAVAFLTRIPVGRRVALDGDDVARGAVLFPLVGAGIGAVVGATAAGLAHVLPAARRRRDRARRSARLLTGALHLDGLADTADALGARSRERALEIMRDHATGAFGTAALVLDLLVKAAALAALAPHGRTVVVVALAAGALAPRGAGRARRVARERARGRRRRGLPGRPGRAAAARARSRPRSRSRPACPTRLVLVAVARRRRGGARRRSTAAGSAARPATCSARRPS